MNKIEVRLMSEGGYLDPKTINDHYGKGIHFITNGWILSAQAGKYNYSSKMYENLANDTTRPDCEIALWEGDGDSTNSKLIELNNDSVMGYVSWEMVIQLVYWLATLPNKPSESEVRDKVLSLAKTDEVHQGNR